MRAAFLDLQLLEHFGNAEWLDGSCKEMLNNWLSKKNFGWYNAWTKVGGYMLIRNGYVRCEDGGWLNLGAIKQFMITRNEELEYWSIVADPYNLKMVMEMDHLVEIETYNKEEEAQEDLDRAFGWVEE